MAPFTPALRDDKAAKQMKQSGKDAFHGGKRSLSQDQSPG